MAYILAAISGFLLFLCFPEYNFTWLAWLAVAPLLLGIMLAKRWWEAALSGLLAGLIFFLGLFSWLKIVGVWVGAEYGIAAWLALSLSQTIFILLFALILYFLFSWIKQNVPGKYKEYLIFLTAPALWMVIEWLRAQGPFASTMGDLAYTQYQALPLLQIVSLVGVYGLSFLILTVNTVLARGIYLGLFTAKKERNWQAFGVTAAISCSLMILALLYGSYSLSREIIKDKKITVAIFQPNVPQDKKLDQKYFQQTKEMFISETKHYRKIQKADLMIWPETIVPQLLLRDRYFIFQAKDAVRSPLIFGTPTLQGGKFFNSMVLLDKQGREQAFYNKEHLVPFGEYLPFKKILMPFLSGTDFFQNDYAFGKRAQVFETPWGKFACNICLESIFPQLFRTQVKHGGKLLLVITNDAWFKKTAALEAHLAMSLVRAVENRRYLIQVANTGYSFVADPCGRILKRSGLEKQEWITAEVALIKGRSLYTQSGDLIVYLAIIFILILGYHCVMFKKKQLMEKKLNKLRKDFE